MRHCPCREAGEARPQRSRFVKEDMMKRTWIIAALTAASVAAMASPAAAWDSRTNAYGWGGGPGFGFGVTVGSPGYAWGGSYAADWGWRGYAASTGGRTCGAPAASYSYGWGYPNRGWSGYAYEPGWSYGYEPGSSVGSSDYGWWDGRRGEFREGFRDRDYRQYGVRGYREGMRGREFTEGRRGVIRTGANFRTEQGGTVGVGGTANFNGGANANVGGGNVDASATVGRGGGRGRNHH
jgi:hypothetical protein